MNGIYGRRALTMEAETNLSIKDSTYKIDKVHELIKSELDVLIKIEKLKKSIK